MLTKSALRLRILLVLAIIVIANFLLSHFFVRLDFTGDKRYTLSNATKNILTELEEPITITAFFSENLPPQIDKVKRDFQDLLVEYSNRSGGNVAYEFVNPNESDEKEQEVMQQGIQPRVISVRERDQMKQQRAYMGAKVQYGDVEEVISVIEPGGAMEYALSSAIKKISGKNKPKLGFVTGHGEASIQSMAQAMQSLAVSYQVEPAQLNDTALVSKYKALVLVAPKDTFKQEEFKALNDFLAAGKGVLIAYSRIDANLQTLQGTERSTGLERWLATKGLDVNADLVIDSKCSSITVQRQQNIFSFAQQIQFPYLPIIDKFADHPVTKGLEQIFMPFTSSLSFNGKIDGITFKSLANSSKNAGIETAPITFDAEKDLRGYDFFTSNITIAGALEGTLSGAATSKMIVYGTGEFAVNGEGQQAQPMQPDNINFFVNGIDWLADDTGLNELRTKVVTSRPIKAELTDANKQFIKFGNFFAPLGLIVLYGLFRYQARKRKRRKWMNEKYS